MGRPWYDTLLILYLIGFGLFLAWAFERTSRLGWALTAFYVTLSAGFAHALLSGVWPPLSATTWIGTAVRVALCLAITWAVVEVARRRWPPRGPLE